MMIETGERSRSHGLSRAVLEAQAACLGLPIWFAPTSWTDYSRTFHQAARRAVAAGMSHGIFGDIAGESSGSWVEGACAAAGLIPDLPLWKRKRSDVIDELLAADFRALIVAVRAALLPSALLGRRLDREMVGELAASGIDICGEGGEYHTIVVDGPGFDLPLSVELGAISLHDGVWFTDVSVGTPAVPGSQQAEAADRREAAR